MAREYAEPVFLRFRLTLAFAALLALGACGGASTHAAHPTTAVAMPDDQGARRAALAALGERAWSAMALGEPTLLLYADADLEILLDAASLVRIGARRLSLEDRLHIEPARLTTPLSTAAYAGICLQGARTEEAGGPLGLLVDGWVFDRMLIIGRRSTGRRVAAWLEGVFVFSDVGFGAIDLERVEEPRWEHTDLEIAPCDLAIRDDLPEIAR